MKLAVLLALVAGASIAVQTVFNVAAQRALGLPVLISLSGFATGFSGLAFALFAAKPEFTARAVAFGVVSGVIGCVILACVTFAVGQGGVARALSLVIAAQLVTGLVLDGFGVLGTPDGLGLPKVLGVLLIIVGGVLVVRF